MKQFNQELQDLQSQIQQKSKAESRQKSLKEQLEALQKEEASLRQIRAQEERDVQRVSGGTLAAFVYRILGSRQQRIDKEEAEAYAAAVRHESVCAQLTSVREDIEANEETLLGIRESERRYKVLLAEKAEAFKADDPIKGGKIHSLEEQIIALKGQIKEVDEAYRVGKEAQEVLGALYQSLNSAENWGVVDLFGGGLISGISKHAHLDEAQSRINRLQVLLRRYTTELADVKIVQDMQIKTGSFLSFADLFMDNLFADFAVLDHISKSQAQVYEVKSKVNDLQSRLLAAKQELSTQLQRKELELEQFVADTPL